MLRQIVKYKTKREQPLVLCTSLIILFFFQSFYKNNGFQETFLVFSVLAYLILKFLTLNRTQILLSVVILCVFFCLGRCTNYEEVDSPELYWSEEMLIAQLEYTNGNKVINKQNYNIYLNRINYSKYKDVQFLYKNNYFNKFDGYYFIKGKYNISNKIFVIREFKLVIQDKGIRQLKNAMVRNLNLSQNSSIITRAMLFGDKSGFSEETQRVFSVSGTMHLFAVSGFHVGCIFLFLFYLTRIFLNISASKAVSLCALIGYLVLVEFSISSIRAYTMLFVWVFSSILGVRVCSLNSLCFAVIFLLFLDSSNISNIGFVLSVSVVLSIIWFMKGFWGSIKNSLNSFFFKIILVNYSAFWGSFLILLNSFNLFTPISLFSNFILIPVFSVLIPFSVVLLLLYWLPGISFLVYIYDNLLTLILKFCLFVSDLPFSYIILSNFQSPPLYKYYLFILVLLLTYGRFNKLFFKLIFFPLSCIFIQVL